MISYSILVLITCSLRLTDASQASQYNKLKEERYGVTNLDDISHSRITIRGFIYWDRDIHEGNIDSFSRNVPRFVADGSIKARYSKHEDIENAHAAYLEMFTSQPFGEAGLKIAEP